MDPELKAECIRLRSSPRNTDEINCVQRWDKERQHKTRTSRNSHRDTSTPETGEICSDNDERNIESLNEIMDDSPRLKDDESSDTNGFVSRRELYQYSKHKHKSKRKRKKKKKKKKEKLYKKYNESSKSNVWYDDEIKVKPKYSVNRKKMKKYERRKKRLRLELLSSKSVSDNFRNRYAADDR